MTLPAPLLPLGEQIPFTNATVRRRRDTVVVFAVIALLISLGPLLEAAFSLRSETLHDLAWLIYTVPTAVAAYTFGLRGALAVGLLETGIVWGWDRNIQEFLVTGKVDQAVVFLTFYNLVNAVSMGVLSERLHDHGRRIWEMNYRLRDMASRDHLTGLYNSRAFHELVPRAIEDAHRGGRPVGLLLIDLDNFKEVNDTFGHPAGDEVLAVFGRCLLNTVRAGDLPCRYGGDEFAVILPGADGEAACGAAERIRQHAAHILYPQGGRGPRITLSFGLAVYPRQATDAAGLMAAADKALYAAKNAGRDRLCTADGREVFSAAG